MAPAPSFQPPLINPARAPITFRICKTPPILKTLISPPAAAAVIGSAADPTAADLLRLRRQIELQIDERGLVHGVEITLLRRENTPVWNTIGSIELDSLTPIFRIEHPSEPAPSRLRIIKEPELLVAIKKDPARNIGNLGARQRALAPFIEIIVAAAAAPEAAERSRPRNAHDVRNPNLALFVAEFAVFLTPFISPLPKQPLDPPESVAFLHLDAAAAAPPQKYNLLRSLFPSLRLGNLQLLIGLLVLDQKRNPPDTPDLHRTARIPVRGGDVGARTGRETLLAAFRADQFHQPVFQTVSADSDRR